MAGLSFHCPLFQVVLYWQTSAGNFLPEDMTHGNSHGTL
jgi:hypothetical protein